MDEDKPVAVGLYTVSGCVPISISSSDAFSPAVMLDARFARDPYDPAYPAPIEDPLEARRLIERAAKEFRRRNLKYHDDLRIFRKKTAQQKAANQPGVNLSPRKLEAQAPVPPTCAMLSSPGTGKTHACQNQLVLPELEAGHTVVIAVPTHALGEQLAARYSKLGYKTLVYRGRKAADPERRDHTMCDDIARIELIDDAAGNVSTDACQRGDKRCPLFNSCGYQRQRRQQAQIYFVTHEILFLERPSFIPTPHCLIIEEAFWEPSLRGLDGKYGFWIELLLKCRTVPNKGGFDSGEDKFATEELERNSAAVYAFLQAKPLGRIHCAELAATISADTAFKMERREWQRKKDLLVFPGMPLSQVANAAYRICQHNKEVILLAQFWRLLGETVLVLARQSPWLELSKQSETDAFVSMCYRKSIDKSWRVPTLLLDSMETAPAIHKQFLPRLNTLANLSVSQQHVYLRQITDRSVAKSMLVPSERATPQTNSARTNKHEPIRRLLRVSAAAALPSRILLVTYQDLETALHKMELPPNLDIAHFNAIRGLNQWKDVGTIIILGRPLPKVRRVEKLARALWGADLNEIEQEANGDIRFPSIKRDIRLRNGSSFSVENPYHPDNRCESVRKAICEDELVNAIGRAHGVSRTAKNLLRIVLITNVVLPFVVDEIATWNEVLPTGFDLMRLEGAIPLCHRDRADAYPWLFVSSDAERKASNRAKRKNPGQTTSSDILLEDCPGFLSINYRRPGMRGPARTLLYDPARIDPIGWLQLRFGNIVILGIHTQSKSEPKR